MKKTILRQLLMLSKRVMYGFLIQLFFCTVLLANTGNAQRKTLEEVKISVNLTDKSLSQFFRLVEAKTDFRFTFSDNLVNLKHRVSVVADNNSLYEILETISRQTDLNFVQVNSNIHVKAATKINERVTIPNLDDITVNGNISDENGEPIPGATVIVEGTNSGTVTDINGDFSISVNEGSVILVSFIGYQSQRIIIANQTLLNIILIEDNTMMDEVVVVGFGTMKKTDLVGSSASANLEAFRESPNVNILQSLQGSVPGVSIGQTNRPGQENSIEIRGQSTLSGSTTPLIIVDGMIFSGRFSDINPVDVENVEVLKDASSRAIYGSMAANGVILITTKPGKKGKPTFNYSGFSAISSPSNNARLLSREEFLQKVRDIEWRNSFTPESGFTERNSDWDFFQSEMRPPLVEGLNNGTDFDWYAAVTRPAHIISHTVSTSGGSERTNFYMSAGYTNDRGFIINDDFSRFTFRLNIQNKITDWLSLGANVASTFSDRSGEAPTMNTLVRSSPLVLPFDEEGNFIVNPVADLNVNALISPTNDNLQKRNRLVGNFFTIISLPNVKGLTYRVNYGNNSVFNREFGSRIFGAGQTGEAFKNNSLELEHNLDNILSYSTMLKKHTIATTFVYGFNTAEFESTSATGFGYKDLTLSYNNLSLADFQRIGSSAWNEALIYQMGRFNYNYDEKYLLTATIRRDGFSGFSKNNKFAIFPSVGFGWAISEESFFDVPFVDYLKARASYGENGNRPGRYSSLA
nr:SusC/RagA family TonB-linked outer membrane protein [Cytophagales bacterium]